MKTQKTKRFIWLFAALAAGIALLGCPAEEKVVEYDTGTATASAQGYAGTVSVTTTMTENVITAVKVDGPGDRGSMGYDVLAKAPAAIIEKQHFDLADVVTSPTANRTKAAIKEAGEASVKKIRKGEFDPE